MDARPHLSGPSLESNLPYLLAQASALASLQIDDLAQSVGLSRNETKTILCLISTGGPEGGYTLNELADIMLVKQPTLSRVVDGMVKDGFLERRTATEDRRTVNITLTDKGKQQAAILADQARTMEERFRTKLGEQESTSLMTLLNLVISRLR